VLAAQFWLTYSVELRRPLASAPARAGEARS